MGHSGVEWRIRGFCETFSYLIKQEIVSQKSVTFNFTLKYVQQKTNYSVTTNIKLYF